MSLLFKIIELFLIFIIIKSFLTLKLYGKKQKKKTSFSQVHKNDIEKFDLKEHDVVDADYEEIK